MRGIGMKTNKLMFGLVIFITIILISSSSLPAEPLDDWKKGDEKHYTGGHTFEEEMWVADNTNTTDDGYNLTSSIFYMNKNNVQAFLIAINKVENETNIGTYPYQLFGLHYYSPEGQEVFIGAIFAFLLGYNNTYQPEKGLPNPNHEDVFFIIPFGAGSLVGENNYIPKIERSATKVDANHFTFEISYKNLYALATPSVVASAIWKTGYIAKFTEFTTRYEITLDEEKGEVRAETYYTIGQVTALWLVAAGIPIPIDVSQFPDTLGITAVHYVATFTSYSRIVGATSNKTIDTGITEEASEDLVLEGANNERVFKIGFRGTYDTLDETTTPPTPVLTDQKAVNVILNAKPLEKILLWRQLLLSADLMSVMAYGMSDTIQDQYTSPRDLKQKAIFNFHTQNFWYAVAFPEWDGYRIQHDPTYTAYTVFSAAPKEEKKEEEDTICGGSAIVLAATTASVCIIGYRKKRKR